MYKAIINDKEFEIEYDASNKNAGVINNEKFEIDLVDLKEDHFSVIRNNVSYNAEIVSRDLDEKTYKIKVNGNLYTVKIKRQVRLAFT